MSRVEQLHELYSGDILLMVDGVKSTEIRDIREAWSQYYNSAASKQTMMCLVTGRISEPARLHPSIKGVYGGNPTGGSIVSFNARAYESYGHVNEQGLNAPVSRYVAEAYTTALNYLLSDNRHKLHYADTTLVFWAEDDGTAYNDLLLDLLNGTNDDNISDDMLYKGINDIIHGKPIDWNGIPVSPENHFYILGLAPNSARLSIRFFVQDRFGNIVKHIQAHDDGLQIDHDPAKSDHIHLYRLLLETINQKVSDKNKAISPALAGSLMHSILTGMRYPSDFFLQIELRLRAEHNPGYEKCAAIKTYLLRNTNISKEVLQMKLNEETLYPPYLLGRLFSVLEALQEAASPGIQATIRDRFFNSACSTPSVVFPQLLRLSQAHLKKLGNKGEVYYSKQITEILSGIDNDFPARLTLQDQGVFQIGYYHQTQKRYTKKEEKTNE